MPSAMGTISGVPQGRLSRRRYARLSQKAIGRMLEKLEDRWLLSSIPLGTPVSEETRQAVIAAYNQGSLNFEANQGQYDPQVQMVARGHGYSIFLGSNGVTLALAAPSAPVDLNSLHGLPTAPGLSAVVGNHFVNANANPTVVGLDALSTQSNYYVDGAATSGIGNFGRVQYQNLYNGVDLVYYGNQQKLEYDFVVHAGGDAGAIAQSFSGVESVSLDAQGRLILHTAAGDLPEDAPVAYQIINGQRQEVRSAFKINADQSVSFELGDYDHTQDLIIDPVMSYSTYLGGIKFDETLAVTAANTATTFYITGWTQSSKALSTSSIFSSAGNEISNPSLANTSSGAFDAFVASITPANATTDVNWITYLGGDVTPSTTTGTVGTSIALDGTNLYVGGYTWTSALTGKVNSNAGLYDGFVAKFDSATGAMGWSRYVGGSGDDFIRSLKVKADGTIWAAGDSTSSSIAGFAGVQSANNGSHDGFVVKLAADGSGVLAGTFVGGAGDDLFYGLTLDSTGKVILVGSTQSNGTTNTTAMGTLLGVRDGLVVSLAADLGSINFIKHLGAASALTVANAVAVDASNNIFTVGSTDAAGSTFATMGPNGKVFQAVNAGGSDAFIVEYNSTGVLQYATLLGGARDDMATAVGVDSASHVVVAGSTWSENLPHYDTNAQTTLGGGLDGFIAKINLAPTTNPVDGLYYAADQLQYLTYLGGSSDDLINGMWVRPDGTRALVVGKTYSSNFPTMDSGNLGAYTSHYPDSASTGSGNLNADGFATHLTLPDNAVSFSVSPLGSNPTDISKIGINNPVGFVVTALDANGLVDRFYRNKVQLTSSDPRAVHVVGTTTYNLTDTAVLNANPSYLTVAAGSGIGTTGGSWTFTGLTFKTLGSQTLTAQGYSNFSTLTTDGIAGSNIGISIIPTVASTFRVSGVPGTVTAGVVNPFTVTALDAYGNTVMDYSGTVHFLTNDTQFTSADVSADSTLTLGTGSFTARFKTVGTWTLRAQDSINSALFGTQGSINVIAANAATFAVSGFATPSTAGVGGTINVQAKDAYGNNTTLYSGTVHLTSSDLQAALGADRTLTSGAGSFTVTLKTASVGLATVTATDTVTSSITGTQSGITVNAAAAASFVVSGFTNPVTAGVSGNLTVQAKDAYGNTATSYAGLVAITTSSALYTLPVPALLTAGTGTFAVTLKTSGTQSITATDTVSSSITGTQLGITVNAAATASYSVTDFPASTVAGAPHDVTVAAKDQFGNTNLLDTSLVTITSSDVRASMSDPAALVGGTKTFSVTLKTVAGSPWSITATTGAITGSQTGITVTPNVGTHFSVSGFSSSVTAGTSLNSVTVQALDAYDNNTTLYSGTVHITSSDAQATLPIDSVLTAGVKTFQVTLKTAGPQSITATDTLTSTITGTQSGITVLAAAGAGFVFNSGLTPALTAGAARSVNLRAKDAYGNITTLYSGTVLITSTDAQAVLPSPVTMTLGTATFNLTLKTAGLQNVTATDQASASITNTYTGVSVVAASAYVLSVSGFTSPITAGVAGIATVQARDLYGNVATSYLGTVNITSTDSKATLPASATLTSGTGTFSVTLKTAGSQSIIATDSLTSTITGSQTGITVNAAAAASFTVTGFTNPIVAGIAGNATIRAYDAYDNLAVGYAGTVHITSSDGQAVLPIDATLTAGAKSFAVTLKIAGLQSITATDLADSTITGVQTGILVTPSTAVALSVSGFSNPVVAGVSSSILVIAKDAYGNQATGYSGIVKITSTDAQVTLPANSTLTGGQKSFAVTLKTAGTQSLIATDLATATITGTQVGIEVTPAAASRFVVSGFTTPVTAGVAGSVDVVARDAFGNLATGYSGTVNITTSSALATLPSSATLTAGAGSFAVTLKTSGTQSITATDSLVPGVTGSQSGIVVNADVATHLSVSGFTTPVVAGIAGTVTVRALDVYGNFAVSYTGTVHLTTADTQATLAADAALVAGTNTFAVTLRTAGSGKSISATDTTTSSITGTQSGITVTPAAVASLSATGFAASPVAGVAGNLTVTALDAFGNTATSYSGTIKITLGVADVNAVLPANAALAGGVGNFAITLKQAGAQSITATDILTPTLTATQSVTVVAAATEHLVVTGIIPVNNVASIVAGVGATMTVKAFDLFGNQNLTETGLAVITSSDGNALLPASAHLIAGAGTFAVTLRTAGTQSITATISGTSNTGSQINITVIPAAANYFTVSGFANPVIAGTVGSVTVRAFDVFNNLATNYSGSVQITSSDGQAVLPQNSALASGAHVFNVTLKTAGLQSISARDSQSALVTGSQANIQVNAAAMAKFGVSGFAATKVAGVLGSVTVTALDTYGNTVTGYSGTVHLSSTDLQATLAADATLTAGVKVFAVTLKTATTVGALASITAKDTVTTTFTGSQSGIIVTPATAASLGFTNLASSCIAGNQVSLNVQAYDAFANATTLIGNDTLSVTISDPNGLVQTPVVTLASGAATVNLVYRTAGAQTVTVQDATLPYSLPGSLTVLAAGASTLKMTLPTSSLTAGAPFTSTITALDPFGNLANSNAELTFTSSDSQAALPTAVSPAKVTLTAGTASLPINLRTAGIQTVTVSSGTLRSFSSGWVVVPGATASFALTNNAATVLAGTTQLYTVTAKDTYGNQVTSYGGTLNIISSDSQARFQKSITDTQVVTTVTLAQGTGSFGTLLRTAASQAVAVYVGDLSGGLFETVTPAVASRLTFESLPTPFKAGTPVSVGLKALDAYGNLATDYIGLVRPTASDPKAIWLTPLVRFAAGQATAQVQLGTRGSVTLSAVDMASSSIVGTAVVTATAGPVSYYTADWSAGPVYLGTTLSVTVKAYDSLGIFLSDFSDAVNFTSTDSEALFSQTNANFFSANFVAGIATSSLVFRTPGNQSLTLSGATLPSGFPSLVAAPALLTPTLGITTNQLAFQVGEPHNVTVTATGSNGSGANVLVHFSSTDSKAILPADRYLDATGSHVFQVTPGTAGLQDLVVTLVNTFTTQTLRLNAAAAEVTPPIFIESDYLSYYSDARTAVLDGTYTSGYQYYLAVGQANYDRPSHLFDETYYRAIYGDVDAAIRRGELKSAYEHYVRWGIKENECRRPSAVFDEKYYREANPDVAAAVHNGAFVSGFDHYLQYGRYENREALPIFDSRTYLAENPDVAAAVASGAVSSAYAHFVLYGLKEGRHAVVNFDDVAYLAANPDVQDAINRGQVRSALDHFLSFGIREGRTYRQLFDERYYLQNNADVQAAVTDGRFTSGWSHYLQYGINEPRKIFWS